MAQQDKPALLFRQQILAMSAYQVANAAGLIKLDAMENPYSWPQAITSQWLDTLRNCQLNRYPDPDAKALCVALKAQNNIPKSSAILLGNGSDEIIQLLLMALIPDSVVLAPEPGFVMYRQIALALGLEYQAIPLLKNNFALDMPSMINSIERHQPKIIFLAYPNNPSGNLFKRESIRQIIDIAPGLVVLDEAYAPFANTSFINDLETNDQLLVMRTVSKLGLAGLRLGFLVGKPNIIGQLNKIRLPYNINTLTQISCEFAFANKAMFDDQTRIICQQRDWVFQQLRNLDGIKPYPSAANFILFRVADNQADALFNALKARGILLKNTSPQGGLLKSCLRVTIGKPEENEAFITAMKASLETLGPLG